MARIRRSFLEPDETDKVGGVEASLLNLGGVTAARTVHPVGWRWSTHVRPVVGTERCRARHVGIVLGDDVAGLAVHEAARVLSAAAAGEVLVSEVAKLLLAPTVAVENRGTRQLKGIDGPRTLYAIV